MGQDKSSKGIKIKQLKNPTWIWLRKNGIWYTYLWYKWNIICSV